MRRRLRKFLPIVLIAMAMQIFAPIGATWAASIAAYDPLQAAVICHSDAASTQGQISDQTGQHRAYDGCCSACNASQTGVSLATPQAAVATPYRQPLRVIWLERAPDLFGSRTGSHAQARAPPQLT
jgi:Protein of unknown function (DUF2946)